MNLILNTITQVVDVARYGILALLVAVLIGLAGLSATWAVADLVQVTPQPIANSCQGGGGGC